MLDESLFISDTIHEREIELADGKKHKMYFKELAAGEFQRFGIAMESEDGDVRVDGMPRLIAASLVTPEGKPAITFERARTLKAEPMLALFRAVQDVSSTQPKKKEAGDFGTS